MVHGAEHSASGQHTLGPHVLGTRVVVRRLLPGETGPTGGPAFTDVLGVCERWSDGECVVRREDGTSVIIPVSQIVSGKPVPPRPSRLMRIPRAEIDARLGTVGAPVWLASIPQLARRLPRPDAAVERSEYAETMTVDSAGGEVRAVRREGWIILPEMPPTRGLLAQVTEWGAEHGASILAILDPAADELVEDLGLVSR